MKKIFMLALTLALTLVFTSCSTRREYYKPEEETKAKIRNQDKVEAVLPARIIHTTSSGATLKNGMFVNKNGDISKQKLEEDERFLGSFDGYNVITTLEGMLKVLQGESVKFEKKLDSMPISANIDGTTLAVLTSSNTIYQIDLAKGETLLEYTLPKAYSIDSEIAMPQFFGNMILFPSVDGKIIAVDRKKASIMRDMVVGSEYFFNNIIALGVFGGNNLVGVTGNKIAIAGGSGGTKYFDEQIKTAIVDNGFVYAFLKDGRIIKLDMDLKVVKETMFRFAIYVKAVIKNGEIFVFEKTGYKFKLDLDLNTKDVLKLRGDIDDFAFLTKDLFYYGRVGLALE